VDGLTVVLGAVTLIFGLVLSAVAFSGKVVRGVRGVVRDELIESGLIRPGTAELRWPNGWHNLPDAIEGLWQAQTRLEAEIRNNRS
jgi:hypothetical protein